MPQRPPRVIRFVAAQLERFPPTRLRARVVLRRPPYDFIVGTAERSLDAANELVCVAEAAAAAVRQAAETEAAAAVSVDKVGRSEALGRPLVLVGVTARRQEESRQLSGFCQVDGDLPRAAALAVLNATNRFLGLG